MKSFASALAAQVILSAFAFAQGPTAYDLVVYGGTAGGVVTAIAAAREGLRVAIVEPGQHLGGMVSGGLGKTDYGKKEVIGGYSREFFERVGKAYGEPLSWYFEPHVAEQVLRAWVEESRVTVAYGERLREKTGVERDGTRIVAITTERGTRFAARMFADASYEADVMAQAAVSYTVGREGSAQYGESLAGRREQTPYHQFKASVSAYDEAGTLLPEVAPNDREPVGAADEKVQAYNFRLCMTQVDRNRAPFPKPQDYDPARYALLARYLRTWETSRGTPIRVNEVMAPDIVKNGKTDTNNNGAFSTDYIGGSYGYPDADYAARARIWQEHTKYVQGFLYFLANDTSVPDTLRREMNTWGLCKDEYTDNGGWPHQLYVREARRMVGDFVMTQKDIQTELTKADAIGMGSYNSDSHNVQRFVNAQGTVENEGDMQVPVTPYQIPYRLIVPKRQEATNLLVPVAFSASHVAYSTLRMEPQYMIIGQAAGVAAKLALESGVPVQDVDARKLTERLRQQGAVMEWRKPD
jgi:hypothetical protein